MKGFKLIDGDLSITNNEIDIIEGSELTAQTISSVLSTKKGEWIFNAEEGIDFDILFGKQRIKRTSIKDDYYQEKYIELRSDNNENAEKLRKRLSGE